MKKHNFYAAIALMLFGLGMAQAYAETKTDTIFFNSHAVKVNANEVTAEDNLNNAWNITTVGTSSFTGNKDYYQIGSSKVPASIVTFTCTLNINSAISDVEAKFGGFNDTKGDIKILVDNVEVGTGALNGKNDVTVKQTTSAKGTTLNVVVSNIAKGIKAYYITYTCEADANAVAAPVITADEESFVESTQVTISAGEGLNVYYTLDGTDPTVESTQYTGPFTISATTTVKAIAVRTSDGVVSGVATQMFKLIPSFDSLEDLAAATDIADGDMVIVTFEDAVIDSIQVTKAGKRSGIYFDILKGDNQIEIYFGGEEVPANWVVGGKVSGTIAAPFKYYGGTWEIAPETGWSWSELTYTSGSTTALDNITVDNKAHKVIENGVIYIYRNGVRYNALGSIAD